MRSAAGTASCLAGDLEATIMTCDVYPSDDALTGPVGTPGLTLTAAFSIEADGDVDVVCRVAGVLRLANCAMTRGSLVREHDERTTIHVEMEGLSLASVENLLRKLSQLTCVFESQARVVSTAPNAAIQVLRITEEGITSDDGAVPQLVGRRIS